MSNERPVPWREIEPKPPWVAMNQAERLRMFEWINCRLFEWMEDEEERGGLWRGTHIDKLMGDPWEKTYPWFNYEAAIRAAEAGDPEPLRVRWHPEIAHLIISPPNKKHVRRTQERRSPDDPVEMAAAEVDRVRAIWSRYYDKQNRPQGDDVTATKIVAVRWGLASDGLLGNDPSDADISGHERVLRRLKHL